MPSLVSGWTSEDRFEGDKVILGIREGDGVRFRSLPAKWSFFTKGLSVRASQSVARDNRVTGVKDVGHGYTRIDCKYRNARRDIIKWLEDARTAQVRAHGSSDLEILEGDVNPMRRLLSDNPSLEISQDPRLVFIDIEVDSRKSILEHKEGNARMLSWGFADMHGNKDVEVLKADDDNAERELFEKLFVALENYDCVLAWYGDGYDFEVIQTRAEQLGVRGGGIPWHRWTWLDHLAVFKKYNMGGDMGGEAKSSFALGHVAGYLLGEGKLDFDASKTYEAWRDDPERLAEYNLKDCELLPRIEEKTGYVALHLAVCHICRIFPDTSSLNATQQGDGFLLRLGDEYGYRWPSKRRFNENAIPEKFDGAYVMTPTRLGAIDSVHVCDFAGLYPSIIRTFNMSPDTKVPGGRKALYGATMPGADILAHDQVVVLPTRDTCFSTSEPGMFRRALDTLVAKRAEYQAEMKKETPGTAAHTRAKRLQAAFKIVANSFYGILGSPWSRFFDREIAEGVTQVGRWLLENVIDEANKSGLDPFYGDTDSVFIAGNIDAMSSLVSRMNDSWRDRLRPYGITDEMPHHIDLDFEKTFSRIIMISAKRYAGRFLRYKGKDAAPDAFPEVKGLEFKRGDTIRLAREMQVEIVNLLLGIKQPIGHPLPTIEQIQTIRARWKQKILHGELEIDEVTLSQSISKPIAEYSVRYTKNSCGCGFSFLRGNDIRGKDKCPQCGVVRKISTLPMHLRVAKQMMADGLEVQVGNRIRYVMIRPPRDSKDRKGLPVPVYTDGAFDRLDREYYWRRVSGASDRVLDKVFPELPWKDSSAEIRERELARRRVDFKGEIADLPLFASRLSADELDTYKETAKKSTDGLRSMRTRKRRTGPRPLNDEDRSLITEEVRTKGHMAASVLVAMAADRGIREEDISSFAKAIPRPARRRRKVKSAPSTSDDDPEPAPARKRRRRAIPVITVRMIENGTDTEGLEGLIRRRQLEEIKAIVEEHPGDVSVNIEVMISRRKNKNRTLEAKVIIPTGLRIATTPEAKTTFFRIVSPVTQVLGWPCT